MDNQRSGGNGEWQENGLNGEPNRPDRDREVEQTETVQPAQAEPRFESVASDTQQAVPVYRNWREMAERGEQQAVSVNPEQERPAYYYAYGSVPNASRHEGTIPSLTPAGHNRKKKSFIGSRVAAFLAGILATGGLMYGADRADLFTGTSASESASGGASYTQGADVRTASLLTGENEDLIADIVAKTSQAVVRIENYQQGGRGSNGGMNNGWDDFFFGTPEEDEGTQGNTGDNLVLAGEGSGFFFDKEGYILTNQHVIGGADEVRVHVENIKEPFIAEVLGADPSLDLAILKVKDNGSFNGGFPILALADTEEIRVGEWAIAIGNPLGFEHSVSVGVVSAKGREISIPNGNGGVTNYKNLLQTDASINPGNSGGPLLNVDGDVIGINSAVSAQAQGIGFAIPTSTVIENLENLKNNIQRPDPYIGVSLADITENAAQQLGLEDTKGALIGMVNEGSPADQAGLETYDVVVEADGKAIEDSEELSTLVKSKKVGERVQLVIIREGERSRTTVIIGNRNEAANR